MVLKVPSSFHFKDTTYHPESRCDSVPQAAISAPVFPPRKEIWNREDFSRQIAIDSLHSCQFSSVADHAGAQKRSLSPTRNAVFRFNFPVPFPVGRGLSFPSPAATSNTPNYHGRQVTKITAEGQKTEADENECRQQKEGPRNREQTGRPLRNERQISLTISIQSVLSLKGVRTFSFQPPASTPQGAVLPVHADRSLCGAP